MVSDPPSGENSLAPHEPLIFVSDASAEAQGLSTALRSRGYEVVDVPLALLVGRVAAQRPALILCDVDADNALETTNRLRDVPGGSNVDVIFLGEPGRTVADMRDAIFHESSGVFTRPVDAYALLRKVEALIGAPTIIPRPSEHTSAAPRGMVRVPSGLPGRNAQAGTAEPPIRPPSTPPSPRLSSRPPPLRASGPTGPTRSPSSPPSLPAPIPLGFGAEPDALPAPLARHIPQSEMSPELERLLARAEQRLTNMSLAVSAGAGRLSPEDEVEAVLPADVLAALDEPLDPEDDDDDFGSSASQGTRTGSVGRTTSGTGGGAAGVNAWGTGIGQQGTGAAGASAIAGSSNATSAGLRSNGPAPAANAAGDGNSPEPEFADGATPAEPLVRRSSIPADLDFSAKSLPARPPTRAPLSSARPHASSRTQATTTEGWSNEGNAVGKNADASGLPPLPPPVMRSTSVELDSFHAPGVDSLPRLTSLTLDRLHTSAADALTEPPLRRREETDPGGRAAMRQVTLPPHGNRERAQSTPNAGLEIPAALGRGDAVRALARAIRLRFVGAVAFEDDAGIRRVVFRDGDFVTAASGIEGESLVAFMLQRGDLSAEAAGRLGRKLPQFGRHAGAALIAHGHLRQDELWTALRAHAEWLVGRIIEISRGAASLERQVPGRLQEEPAVFGGATGAEVLVEIVRRTVAPEDAVARLGGKGTLLSAGEGKSLLPECALSDSEAIVVKDAVERSTEELVQAAGYPDFASVLYALTELGVLDKISTNARQALPLQREEAADELDEEALRTRIQNRKALVDDGDYFALLGVGRTATAYDIRRAYLELRREFEPTRILTGRTADLKDDVDTILEVVDEAYEILRDQLRRDRYRRALDARPR